MLLGDSLSTATYNDWWTQATTSAGRTVSVLTTSAVGGERADQILARVRPDVIDHNPTWVSVLAGTNDVGQSVSAATIEANLSDIYDACTAYGAKLIVYTIPPRTTSGEPMAQILRDVNAWIRANYSSWSGALLCDWSDALSENDDEADPIDSYFVDGVHPNSTGRAVMAGVLDDVLASAPSL